MFKLFRVFFLLVAFCVCSHAAVDMLYYMSPEMQKFVAPYIEKSKAMFPAVKQKYISGDYVREKRNLFVQMNVSDKDGVKEMAFIRVIWCAGKKFQGVVANNLVEVKETKLGDTVSFAQDQIHNWVVVDSNQREEGNFVGKAIEAFMSQKVGVFFEVVYKKGRFTVTYLDAKEAQHGNSVDGIIPEKVIAKIAERLKASLEKKKREGQKFEEGKPFYTYGVYDCHTGETEP